MRWLRLQSSIFRVVLSMVIHHPNWQTLSSRNHDRSVKPTTNQLTIGCYRHLILSFPHNFHLPKLKANMDPLALSVPFQLPVGICETTNCTKASFVPHHFQFSKGTVEGMCFVMSMISKMTNKHRHIILWLHTPEKWLGHLRVLWYTCEALVVYQ